MAFKAKLINGAWYVGKGKSYYPDTQCDTESEAEKKAVIWEMRALYNRAEELYQTGVDKGYFDPDCFGDYLC